MMKNRQRQKDILFSILIFLQRICRQLADSEALYHADAGTYDLCVRRIFDLAENAWVLLWYHFGHRQRVCGEFRLHLSVLCL